MEKLKLAHSKQVEEFNTDVQKVRIDNQKAFFHFMEDLIDIVAYSCWTCIKSKRKLSKCRTRANSLPRTWKMNHPTRSPMIERRRSFYGNQLSTHSIRKALGNFRCAAMTRRRRRHSLHMRRESSIKLEPK